jgi:hypothetical protein
MLQIRSGWERVLLGLFSSLTCCLVPSPYLHTFIHPCAAEGARCGPLVLTHIHLNTSIHHHEHEHYNVHG